MLPYGVAACRRELGTVFFRSVPSSKDDLVQNPLVRKPVFTIFHTLLRWPRDLFVAN